MEANTEPAANEREGFPDRTRTESRAPFAAAAWRFAYGYDPNPAAHPFRKAEKKRSGDDDTEETMRLRRDHRPETQAIRFPGSEFSEILALFFYL